MASAGTVELPQFKGRAGWEFTDISELDLAAYERVGEEEATPAAPMFPLPEDNDRPPALPEGVIVSTLEDDDRPAELGEAPSGLAGLRRR